MEKLRAHSVFSFFLVMLTLALMAFSTQTNYFFKNFVFISILAAGALVYFAGAFRAGLAAGHLGTLTALEGWFFADLCYNVLSISYSHVPRVSVEECLYQCAYLTVYLLARYFVIFDPSNIVRAIKFMAAVSLVFVCRVLYITMFKFQLIGSDGRISHDSMHPNLLASFILIALSAYVFFLARSFAEGASARRKLLFAVPVALYLFTIFMTSSRGGLLGFAFAALAVSFLYLRNSGNSARFKYVLASFAATGAALAALNFDRVYRVFWETGFSALRQRAEIWQDAARLFLENPLFGVGSSAYCYSVQKFSGSSMIDAHNFLMQKLCDLGAIGTFIYLTPLALVFRMALSEARGGGTSDATRPALGYSVIFMLIAVFVNSSLSPHYILPILSLYMMLVLGLFSGARTSGAPTCAGPRKGETSFFILELAAIAALSGAAYLVFNLLSIFIAGEVYLEFDVWRKPAALLVGIFVYSFRFSGRLRAMPGAPGNPPQACFASEGVGLLGRASAAAFILIMIFMTWRSWHFFVAEKANGLGMTCVSAYSMKKAAAHFDTAIKYDPTNVAYLVNKSYLYFMTGFIKNRRLAGNHDIGVSLECMEKAGVLTPYDELIKSALVFLKSKYRGETDHETVRSDRRAKKLINFNAGVNEQILIQSYPNAFSKFVDIFGDDGYSVFLEANEGLRRKILDIMYSERDIRPGTRLEPYFNYISFALKLGVNIDFPNIDKFLISGVHTYMKGVNVISQFIPVAGFRERSATYIQQNELVAAVSVLLPVIWRDAYGLTAQQMREKFTYMFGSGSLFPIVDYFLYGNDSALKEFANYDPFLRDYLESMAHFSNGSFEVAVRAQEATFKKNRGISTLNSVLMSWIYYKAGDLAAARDITLYCQTHTLTASKRDLTFKRDILFGANMHYFYYLPLQAYYNEYVMLALIRLNRGDRSKVIYEVFRFLRDVVYVE